MKSTTVQRGNTGRFFNKIAVHPHFVSFHVGTKANLA